MDYVKYYIENVYHRDEMIQHLSSTYTKRNRSVKCKESRV